MYKKRYLRDRNRFNYSQFSDKKGQVTVFIIVGILLLLAIVLILVLKTEITTFKPEEIIPTQKGKVESYISACISDLGEEALLRVGNQGGYVEVPEHIAKDGSSHLRTSPFSVVPYWAVGNNIRIPPLSQIKVDIDKYVKDNLRSCVFDLKAFQETYDIIEKSDLTVSTDIVESRVIFNVNWQIEVRDKSGDKITTLIDHVSESPIKLKRVHEMATKIIEREMEELKLEDITQDLIALEHADLPLSGVELSCKKKVWNVKKVKETLQDMLRINIKELKISGTEFVQFPDELPYYQNHYVWDFGAEFVKPDVSVVFNYNNNYPLTFQVTPTQGGRMKSGLLGGTDILSNICLQIWKFTYDVEYPVLVRVKDETTGYNFNIALMVHLVRNMPNRNVVLTAQPSAIIDYPTDEDYCTQAKIPTTVFTWENVDSEDGTNYKEPLNNVDISFTCLKYRCEMGQTQYGGGYQATTRINLPYCVGGIMRGEKDGYKEDWVRVVTSSGKEVELNLAPLFNFPTTGIKVMKHEFRGVEEGEKIGTGKFLDDDEFALIKIVKKKDGEEFHKIEQVIGAEEELSQMMNISLLGKATYTYELDIQVFDDEDFIGGYKGNWTVPWGDLEPAQEMIFHTVSKERGSEAEVFDVLMNLKEYSQYVPSPELK